MGFARPRVTAVPADHLHRRFMTGRGPGEGTRDRITLMKMGVASEVA